MTREENLHWLDVEIQLWESECQSKYPIKEALYAARKALEREPYGDTISRKEVIDAIYHECSGENLDIDFAKVLLLQRAIKILPSVTPQEPRWIPITERLPDNSGRYLVNYSSGYVGIAHYYESVSKWGCTTTERIVKWMPLPEAI